MPLLPFCLLLPLQAPSVPALSPRSLLQDCEQIALLVRDAGRSEVQQEYSLGLAKTLALLDPQARARSLSELEAARAEGWQLAERQFQARLDLGRQLGCAPYDPVIDAAAFGEGTLNLYFPLVPGTVYTYEAAAPEGKDVVIMEVTRDTRMVLGVSCKVVHVVEHTGGVLVEDTADYYAEDAAGNVWYFGELTQEYEDGRVRSVDGSWIAGENGAKPGILVPAAPRLGDTYRQEYALGESEDCATVMSLSRGVSVPLGFFSNTLETRESTPVEPDEKSVKNYAPGIGLVLDVELDSGRCLELVDVRGPLMSRRPAAHR